MEYRKIDLEKYPRKKHFDYFRSLAYPYGGLTVNVEITNLLDCIKKRGLPFFHVFLYAVTRAANSVPEFRQRIYGDGIIEYDECYSSYTVSLPDETYCYCKVNCQMPVKEFVVYSKEQQKKAINSANIDIGKDGLGLLFISSVPWITYTSLIQPVPMPADSNPRIMWGKYFEDSAKVLIPVTVLCHHALVDGIHINKFYQNLQSQIADLCKQIEAD